LAQVPAIDKVNIEEILIFKLIK